MATISKTGIQDGLTSKAEHLTRIIEALDGTTNTEIIATGSFSGSFNGIHTGTIASASYAVSASFATTASFASTAVTASFALSGVGIFPFTGSAAITGSLQVIGDVEVNGNSNVQSQLINNTIATTLGIESLRAGSTTLVYLHNGANKVTVGLSNPSTYDDGSTWSFIFPTGSATSASFELSSPSSLIFGSIMGASGGGSSAILSGSSTVTTTPAPSSNIRETKVEVQAARDIWHIRVTARTAADWIIG
jgi:hypothetical protein